MSARPAPRAPADAELLQRIERSIRELRNHRDVDLHWPWLHELLETRTADCLRVCNSRWLVSICDTYADFGNEIESRNALLISGFVNTLRIAETCRFICSAQSAESIARTRDRIVPLYDGISSFAIDRQDALLNLSKRYERLLRPTPSLQAIRAEIKARCRTHDSVIREFMEMSELPERDLPDRPFEHADNHGIR